MAYQMQPQGASVAVPTHSLLAQVLSITALGLCVTALAAWTCQGVPALLGFAALIVGFVLLFVINRDARKRSAFADRCSTSFTFLRGRRVGSRSSGITSTPSARTSIVNAAVTTGLGMFALAAIVYATGLDLRRFQGNRDDGAHRAGRWSASSRSSSASSTPEVVRVRLRWSSSRSWS